jgi:general secretion pathway protein C
MLLGLLGALALVLAVRLLWTVVTPSGPLGDWRGETAQILSPAEAQTLFASFDPFFRSVPGSSGAGAVTALDLTLFGVNMNEASGGGSAILAGADGVQTSFAVGDEIMPGVKLAAVAFDHVILDRGGTRESLFLDQSAPAPSAAVPASSGPALVPTSELTAPAGNLGELSPQAVQAGIALSPRSEAGRVTGLAVQPQGDGAAFRAAGLRPGDVVRRVNGRPVGSAGDLAAQVQPGARISLEVERGSAVVPIALIIGKP